MEKSRFQSDKILIRAGLFFSGFINGLFGSGGGMTLLPVLKRQGLSQHEAHASSLCVTFALSLVSTGLYLWDGRFSFETVFPYLPGGVLGAILGGLLLNKIPPLLLRRFFGLLVLLAGGRLLFR